MRTTWSRTQRKAGNTDIGGDFQMDSYHANLVWNGARWSSDRLAVGYILYKDSFAKKKIKKYKLTSKISLRFNNQLYSSSNLT